ncbi:hypothetical protein FA13DRAFT_1089654 [Coprinellus micaceus]|uniref:Uncharacterized protein n=1 Tax=Coprinellus micaceus TaxID=71717 RepID=A0A4Y7TSH6_COPMI|nr:hypothetical protein FA13DRAFT_1089654 [Coprinellus micaceus]
MLFRRFTLVLGSLHLTVMAALGLWLWSDPSTFGSPASSCVLESANLAVLGVSVPFASGPLRIFSLVIYGLFLIPGVNLLLPMAAFLSLFLWHHSRRRKLESLIPTVSPPHPSASRHALSPRGIARRLKRTYTRCIHPHLPRPHRPLSPPPHQPRPHPRHRAHPPPKPGTPSTGRSRVGLRSGACGAASVYAVERPFGDDISEEAGEAGEADQSA